MEEEFDFIILGTGIVECALSWALSHKGKKVLQIDSQKTYGSDLRTLNYTELHEHFKNTPNEELVKLNREFNIDLMPKLILADGKVKTFLQDQNLFDVLEFANINGSFIFKNSKLHNVPTSQSEAMTSGAISFFQKGSVMGFFWGIKKYIQGEKKDDLPKTTREFFSKFGLNKESQDFIGHAIALNLNDDYLERSPVELIEKIGLFIKSLIVFENNVKSPFIYTLYGTSELSQVFSRRAAVCGAIFRINTPVLEIDIKEEIEITIENKIDNKIEKIKGKNVLGEPFYFLDVKRGKINENEKNNVDNDKNIVDNDKIIVDNDKNIVDNNKIIYNEKNKFVEEKKFVEKIGVESDKILQKKIVLCEEKQVKMEIKEKLGCLSLNPRIKVVRRVIHCTCIIKGEIKFIKGCSSAQVIFLASDLKRKNDIFLLVLGEKEKAAPKDYKIAMISTVMETENPEDEIKFVMNKLGDVVEKHIKIRNIYAFGECENNVFISNTVDQSTHFESVFDEIVRLAKMLDCLDIFVK